MVRNWSWWHRSGILGRKHCAAAVCSSRDFLLQSQLLLRKSVVGKTIHTKPIKKHFSKSHKSNVDTICSACVRVCVQYMSLCSGLQVLHNRSFSICTSLPRWLALVICRPLALIVDPLVSEEQHPRWDYSMSLLYLYHSAFKKCVCQCISKLQAMQTRLLL